MTDSHRLSRFVYVVLLLFVFTHPAYAWNSTGHRLIAQIAYDQLTPQVKKRVNTTIQQSAIDWKSSSFFVNAAAWPDYLPGHGIKAFSTWHYIDIPYSGDGSATQSYDPHNVVWAIEQAKNVLGNKHATVTEKGLFLRFLAHFVGDIHQPLHCIERYSRQLPKGDQGGNLFPVHDRRAKNLHQLWDGGVGYLDKLYGKHRRSNKRIRHTAQQLEKRYPPKSFSQQLQVMDAKSWAKEGFRIAKNRAYKHLQPNTQPSASYVHDGQAVAARRMVLAGYRLGYLLNDVLS